MKKVAIISNSYAPNIWSGLGRHTFSLAYGLARRNYAVSVYTMSERPESEVSLDGQVTLHTTAIPKAHASQSAARLLKWKESLNTSLVQEDFDCLLYPNMHGFSAMPENYVRKVGFLPFLFGVTGWIGAVSDTTRNEVIEEERQYMRSCDELVVSSSTFGRTVADYSYREINFLPNCHLDLSAHDLSNVEHVRNSISYIGRVNKQKSLETILRALALLPHVTLNLAYPDNSDFHLTKTRSLINSLGIEGRVNFLGWMATLKAKQLYASSSASIVSGYHEPYGYPVLDGMAYGTIPLVSEWSKLDDYVDKSRTFHSVSSLAASISTVLALSDKQRQAEIAYNRYRIINEFGVNKMMDGLEEIINGNTN